MSSQPAEHSFPADLDAGVFWNQHKTKILSLLALVVAGIVFVGAFKMVEHRKVMSSRDLLLAATTSGEYRTVIDKYPGTMAAANAHLLLAAEQRSEGKYEEAIATLKSFLKKYPNHPLAGGAQLSIGETERAAKQWEKARETFQETAGQYRDSYGAPAAMLAEAAMYRTEGKPEEARRVFEDLISQFPESYMAQQAQAELRSLKAPPGKPEPAAKENDTLE